MAFRKNIITIEPPPAIYACSIALFCSLLSMCYLASIFHVLTRFRAATLMLQTFQSMIKEFLGRGSILSDAVGVDGLTYLPSLPLLS